MNLTVALAAMDDSMGSMSSMPHGWHLSSLWIIGVLLIGIEELGMRRLRQRCTGRRRRSWRARAWLLESSIAIVCLIDSSPLMGASMSHMTIHMLIHVVEMFYIPILLIVAAPFVPALFALPVGTRRTLLRWWYVGPGRPVATLASRAAAAPILVIVVFNATMIFWHLPKVFDWAARHWAVHTWLMTPSYIVAGYLFWRLLLGSHPRPPRASLKFQAIAVIVTSFEMVILAMAMAIFSKAAWYDTYVVALGIRPALHDQQLAAGILWICGDFWAPAAIILIVRRAMDSGTGLSDAFERSLGRA